MKARCIYPKFGSGSSKVSSKGPKAAPVVKVAAKKHDQAKKTSILAPNSGRSKY